VLTNLAVTANLMLDDNPHASPVNRTTSLIPTVTDVPPNMLRHSDSKWKFVEALVPSPSLMVAIEEHIYGMRQLTRAFWGLNDASEG
jgi:hypothetical protein